MNVSNVLSSSLFFTSNPISYKGIISTQYGVGVTQALTPSTRAAKLADIPVSLRPVLSTIASYRPARTIQYDRYLRRKKGNCGLAHCFIMSSYIYKKTKKGKKNKLYWSPQAP